MKNSTSSLRNFTAVWAIFLSVSLVFSASAQVIVDFNNYNQAVLAGQAGGVTGLTGSWAGQGGNRIVAGNLSGPTASSSLIFAQSGTAQKYQVHTAATDAPAYDDAHTYISLSSPLATKFYISFLAEAVGNPAFGIGLNTTGLHTDFGTQTAVMFNATNFELRRYAGTNSVVSTSRGALTDYFVILEIDPTITTNNVKAWLNPTSMNNFSNPPTLTQSVAYTSSQVSSISVFGYRSNSSIDNLRLGSNLNAVVVPEPGTALLLLSGAAMMLLPRRRSA